MNEMTYILENLHFLSDYERYVVTKGILNELEPIDMGEYYLILKKNEDNKEFNKIFLDSDYIKNRNATYVKTIAELGLGFLIFLTTHNYSDAVLYYVAIGIYHSLSYVISSQKYQTKIINKTLKEYLKALENSIYTYKLDNTETIMDRIYADLDSLKSKKYPNWEKDALTLKEIGDAYYKTNFFYSDKTLASELNNQDQDIDILIERLILLEHRMTSSYKEYCDSLENSVSSREKLYNLIEGEYDINKDILSTYGNKESTDNNLIDGIKRSLGSSIEKLNVNSF